MHKGHKGRSFGVSTTPPSTPTELLFQWCVVLCGFSMTSSPLHCRNTLAPYAFENTLRVNPVFENDDGVLTQVSTLPYASSSASSQSQQSEQEHFASIENIRLSIEVHRVAQRGRLHFPLTSDLDLWRPLALFLCFPCTSWPYIHLEVHKKHNLRRLCSKSNTVGVPVLCISSCSHNFCFLHILVGLTACFNSQRSFLPGWISTDSLIPEFVLMLLSPQIPRQLYTTRSEQLMSEMVGFHHCIPHNKVMFEFVHSHGAFRHGSGYCFGVSEPWCFLANILRSHQFQQNQSGGAG